MTYEIPKGAGRFLVDRSACSLAILGLSATNQVSGKLNIMRFLKEFEDTRERDQDLQFARSEILSMADHNKLEDGGEIETLSLGTVEWEMDGFKETDILDVYQITLRFKWEETEEIDAGERLSTVFALRPTWTQTGTGLQSKRNRLREEKRRKIQEIVDRFYGSRR